MSDLFHQTRSMRFPHSEDGEAAHCTIPYEAISPGTELYKGVYLSVLGVYTWLLLSIWIAFGNNLTTILDLIIVGLVFVISFVLPAALVRTSLAQNHRRSMRVSEYLSSDLETASGSVPPAHAWLQILIIPLSLACAMSLIGAVYLYMAI